MDVDNSGKQLDLEERNVEKTNKLLQNAKQGDSKSLSAKRLEILGRRAVQHQFTVDFSNTPDPFARTLFDAITGGAGKMVVYQVAADEHTVLTGIGVSQERMAAAVGQLKQPSGALPKTQTSPGPRRCSRRTRSGWSTSVSAATCG